MIRRADFHFHPNLPIQNTVATKRRADTIWKAFKTHQLDAVIVTEHSYKSPETAYSVLETYRDGDTHLIPGVECLTREGIDLIVFARKPEEIYTRTDILTPYGLSLEEMVREIDADPALYGIVVHPHTPGTTSIVRIAGEEVARRTIATLGFLERHNGALVTLNSFLVQSGLRHVFPNLYQATVETIDTPEYLCKEARILTVGSDAHFPEELGWVSEINAEADLDYDALFDVLIARTGALTKSPTRPSSALIPTGVQTFLEFLAKKNIRPAHMPHV